MTKSEFISSLPYFIEHPAHGAGELEAYATPNGEYVAQYRHANNTTSYGTVKGSWKALYDDLRPYLEQQGHCG